MTLQDYFIMGLTILIVVIVVSLFTFIFIWSYFKIKNFIIKKKAPKELLLKKEVKNESNENYRASENYAQDREREYISGLKRSITERELNPKKPISFERSNYSSMGDKRKFKFS